MPVGHPQLNRCFSYFRYSLLIGLLLLPFLFGLDLKNKFFDTVFETFVKIEPCHPKKVCDTVVTRLRDMGTNDQRPSINKPISSQSYSILLVLHQSCNSIFHLYHTHFEVCVIFVLDECNDSNRNYVWAYGVDYHTGLDLFTRDYSEISR